jgi:hypothetical protein
MNTELFEDLKQRLQVIDNKLNTLLLKGGNDEKLVTKKRDLLKQIIDLKNENNEKV